MNAPARIVRAGAALAGADAAGAGFGGPAPAPAGDTIDVGLMRLAGRNLALPADRVREVVPRPARLQPVFTPGGGALGTVVIRGRVIPIVNLRPLLGLPSAGEADRSVATGDRTSVAAASVGEADRTSVAAGDRTSAGAASPTSAGNAGPTSVGEADRTSTSAAAGGPTSVATPPESAGVVVVLRDQDRLLGLAIDSVSGLARLPRFSLQSCAVPGETHLVSETFLLGDEVVGLIDPAAVFALPGVPHAREADAAAADSAGARRPIVLLEAAGAALALEAARVVATMPAGAVRPSPVPTAQWTGVVDYLGFEVPVVDDLALLGLSGRAGEAGPVVILRVEGDKLIGLRIDRVRRILQVRAADVRPLPAVAARLYLFCGAVADEDGRESLLLGEDALARSDALRRIAALTRTKAEAAAATAGAAGAAGAREAARPHLVFRAAGKLHACDLISVTQIVRMPESVTRLDVPGSALAGLASHAGRPLPLVDLGDPATREPDRAAVLVIDVDGALTGCLVDALEMVADVPRQKKPQGPHAAGPAWFIEAVVAGKPQAINVCDLADQARART